MKIEKENKVRLWEDKIQWDESGRIIHHPLNSRYFIKFKEDTVSYGHLTFAGHDLDKSTNLDDVKVYYLEFKSNPESTDSRAGWADSLRIEVLKSLTRNKYCWYLSMIDSSLENIEENLIRILGKELKRIEVKSEKPYGFTYGFIPRTFIEVPNEHLSEVVRYFWSNAVPGYPIEGYSKEPGQIELFKKWDAKPRDDRLFRDVIDRTYVDFYTFPAENQCFVFVTNKLSYSSMLNIIKLKELQNKARFLTLSNK